MFGAGWAKNFDQYLQSARVAKMVRYRLFFCGNFQLSLNNNQVVFLHRTAFLTLLLTLLSLDISYGLRKLYCIHTWVHMGVIHQQLQMVK